MIFEKLIILSFTLRGMATVKQKNAQNAKYDLLMTIIPLFAFRWVNPFEVGIDDLNRILSSALARVSAWSREMIATSYHCKEINTSAMDAQLVSRPVDTGCRIKSGGTTAIFLLPVNYKPSQKKSFGPASLPPGS